MQNDYIRIEQFKIDTRTHQAQQVCHCHQLMVPLTQTLLASVAWLCVSMQAVEPYSNQVVAQLSHDRSELKELLKSQAKADADQAQQKTRAAEVVLVEDQARLEEDPGRLPDLPALEQTYRPY